MINEVTIWERGKVGLQSSWVWEVQRNQIQKILDTTSPAISQLGQKNGDREREAGDGRRTKVNVKGREIRVLPDGKFPSDCEG